MTHNGCIDVMVKDGMMVKIDAAKLNGNLGPGTYNSNRGAMSNLDS